MNLGLGGRVILVAAGSRGLGRGTAKACAAEGAVVRLCGRDDGQAAATGDALAQATGSDVQGAGCDVTRAGEVEAWVEGVLGETGRIDGLLVNAGGPPAGGFDAFDDAAWQAAFETTLLSAVRLVRAVLPAMRAGGGGSILAVTSLSVREPIDHLLLSNVFRAGVAGLMKTLARELAGEGIRCNCLVPGRLDTDRVRSLDEGVASRDGRAVEDVRAAMEAAIPLGRYGEEDEFGRAAAFLLSPAAAYINGATLSVDGGLGRAVG